MTSASQTIARASPARFCMPPEISDGYFSAASSSPTAFSAAATRRSISSALSRVVSTSGSATFSHTVFHASSAPDWKR